MDKPKRRRQQPELALQRDVVTILSALGYTVLETGKSRGRVKCGSCGAYSTATGWQGNTPGLPDLYVHRSGLRLPVAVALELKSEKGKPTLAQQLLADNMMTYIVRSIGDALRCVRNVEERLGETRQVSKIEDVWRTATAKENNNAGI